MNHFIPRLVQLATTHLLHTNINASVSRSQSGVGATATLVGANAVLANSSCSSSEAMAAPAPPPSSHRDTSGRRGHSPPATLEQKKVVVDVVDLVPCRPIATSPAVSSSADPKLGSTYADRFVRLIHLMDPRHTMTTEGDVRRYQRLLKDHTTGEVCASVREGARSGKRKQSW